MKCNQKCFNPHCERENTSKIPKDVNGNNSKKNNQIVLWKKEIWEEKEIH